MAGVVNSILSGLKTGFDSLIRTDSDDKDDAPTTHDTAARSKRPAPPTSIDDLPRTKRLRPQISAEERRLLQADYPPTRDSIPFDPPADEWNVSTTMTTRKKPGSGGFAPKNTLAMSSPGLAPLSTFRSRGDNVPEPPSKRQKMDRETGGDWFNREHAEEQGPVTLPRQPSIISLPSVNSQSQEQSSQKFRHSEFTDVSNKLAPTKKRGRKPKSGAFDRSSDFPDGTTSDPVPVEDDDDVEFVNEQPARRPNTQTTPRAPKANSLLARSSPNLEVDNDFARRRRERQQPASQHLLNKNTTILTPKRATGEQRLSDVFQRDDEPPLTSQPLQQTQPRLRDKMRSESLTTHAVKPGMIADDMSEDELAQDHTPRRQPQNVGRPKSRRSPSPNNTSSTYFPKRRRKEETPDNISVPLPSLRMSAGNWESEFVFLIFSYRHKGVQFMDTRTQELLSVNGSPIQLKAAHVGSKVYYSEGDSNGVVLVGAKDGNSKGRIWLDFNTAADRNRVLKAIEYMEPRVQLISVDEAKWGHICNASETFFSPKSSQAELAYQVMANRQAMAQRGVGARERAKAAQRGIELPEPEDLSIPAPTPRRARMKDQFSNQPAAKPEQDYTMQPPTPRGEPAVSTRSSRRIGDQESGRTLQISEPIPEKWSETHALPKWDGPLTYPASGPKRTTVHVEDLKRLDDGEFLNDNLIEFCLRWLEEHHPEIKNKAHIFNTFFYTTLSTMKAGRKGFNYDAVKRWTRNIDLFAHPFVAVPINANFHWFLVLICNLDNLEKKLKGEDLEEEKLETELPSTAQEPAESQPTIPNDLEIPESPQDEKDVELSQGVKRISLDASQKMDSSLPSPSKLKPILKKGGKRPGPPPQQIDPNTPILILLDSLGSSHNTVIRNLKEYIANEGRDKRGLDFTYSELRGTTAKGIPQQTNFCDCGLYLIGYMEAFLRNPTEFVRKVLSRELDHNNDFADFDPAKKRVEIRERLLVLAEQQKTEKRERKKQAALAKKISEGGSSRSLAATPTLQSSPPRATASRESHRMIQSSPVKPPPRQMHTQIEAQRSSLPVALYHKSSPEVAHEPEDDMLFNGDTENELHQYENVPSSHHFSSNGRGDDDQQPNNIAFQQEFGSELLAGINHAAQAGSDNL